MAQITKNDDYPRLVASNPLRQGGGDGTFNGMEHRVAALEALSAKLTDKVDGVKENVSELRTQIAVLNERVSHLPSKEFIYKGIAGLVTVMVAVATLAPKLQQVFGILPK